MPSLNEALLMGHVGKDPETSMTQGGKTRTVFSLATSTHWKQDDEWKSSTTWHNIVYWGENPPEMHKGDLVLIHGRIDNRTYEKDGETKYISEVVARKIQWLRPPNKSSSDDKMPDERDESVPF